MVKIEYSPKALEDLQDICEYVVNNWGESVSNRVIKKITSDIRRLNLKIN